jgi:hypothetical protein
MIVAPWRSPFFTGSASDLGATPPPHFTQVAASTNREDRWRQTWVVNVTGEERRAS